MSKLSIKAEEVEMELNQASLKGESLLVEEDRIVSVSTLLSVTSQALLQAVGYVHSLAAKLRRTVASAKSRFGKKVDEVDGLASLSAGRVREESKSSYRVRAESANVKAKEQIDIDAQHIKVG